MNDEEQVIGLSWWQPDQWERLKEISEDRDLLDDSYEDWRKNASRAIQEIESAGKKVRKVKINLEELLIWCNENGFLVNGESRSKYTAKKLQNFC